MDNDNDMPQLSADTLKLLQEFNQDKDAHTKQFEALKTHSENVFANGTEGLSMDLFSEDWNQSQFWYSDNTARTLAQSLLDGCDGESAIAVVSAPSVFVQLKKLLHEATVSVNPKIYLLEYDTRFEVFRSEFVQYDLQQPLRIPQALKGKFDRIICDPPFLSEDCQAKIALTVRYLVRSWEQVDDDVQGVRLIMCTGERMEPIVTKLYAKVGMKTTTFEPEHSKGLSNEFRCYANFECDKWSWR